MFPRLRLRAVFKTRVNVLSDRPSTYTYGSNGILMKFDFSNDKSRFLQSKGSQAAILHVWQTWATPEVSSNMSRFWKILTMISISMSSHLLIEEYVSSITITCEKFLKIGLITSPNLERIKKRMKHVSSISSSFKHSVPTRVQENLPCTQTKKRKLRIPQTSTISVQCVILICMIQRVSSTELLKKQIQVKIERETITLPALISPLKSYP